MARRLELYNPPPREIIIAHIISRRGPKVASKHLIDVDEPAVLSCAAGPGAAA